MDISKITDHLYISASPQASHIHELESKNIRLIISMIGGHQPPEAFTYRPFRLLWLQTIDSIFIPIPIEMLAQGVEAALPIIQNGDGVLVYCVQGRHRSVAMATAILIALGYTCTEALNLVQRQRKVADPKAWHIYRQIRMFEMFWRDQTDSANSLAGHIGNTYSKLATTIVSRVILRLSE